MKRTSVFFLTLCLGLLMGLTVSAQDPNYILSMSSDSGQPGAMVTLTVNLDNNGGDISGWSFGACHDSAVLELAGTPVDGSTSATVNGGGAPGFDAINAYPDGWTVGFVVDLMGNNFLSPGTGYELNLADYNINASAATGTSTDVCFCDTLGTPPVATVVVVAGASIVPTQNCGTVDIVAGPPPFQYIAQGKAVNYNPADGAASFSTNLEIAEDANNPGYPNDTQGFSMGLGYDDTLLTITAADQTGDLAALNGGSGAGFFQANLSPVGGAGVTIGVVYNLLGGVFLQFPAKTPVISVSFDTVASALMGDMVGQSTDLTWTDGLGMPTVANVVVVNGASLVPDFFDGTIDLVPVIATAFRRGDCNDDGTVNIADGIWILNSLFHEGPMGPCAAACDVNDSGSFDSTDAIYIFNQQFLDGDDPPAPFPDCGTQEGADCDSFSSCP